MVSSEEILFFSEIHNIQYAETSAKIGTGIEEALKDLAKMILKKKKQSIDYTENKGRQSLFIHTKSLNGFKRNYFQEPNVITENDFLKKPTVSRCC